MTTDPALGDRVRWHGGSGQVLELVTTRERTPRRRARLRIEDPATGRTYEQFWDLAELEPDDQLRLFGE